ncbi:MAG: hypothetical protein JWL89_413 [Candidatus Saccharibacteria bacterium]|nr:hypothetical protein [Candidatus Saccharibacteria bacterium]
MAEAVGTEKWLGELQKSEAQHLRRVRRLKDDIRDDEHMDSLDRLVLGATGSAEQLSKHQALAKKVGEQAGKPLIVIGEIYNGHVLTATGGIIVGEVEPEEHSHPTLKNDRKKPLLTIAKLNVPVLPVASYRYINHGVRNEEKIYHNGEATAFDRRTNMGRITVASFDNTELRNRGFNPENDCAISIERDRVLVGRQEIYASPYFAQGVGRLLLALEEQVKMPIPSDVQLAS